MSQTTAPTPRTTTSPKQSQNIVLGIKYYNDGVQKLSENKPMKEVEDDFKRSIYLFKQAKQNNEPDADKKLYKGLEALGSLYLRDANRILEAIPVFAELYFATKDQKYFDYFCKLKVKYSKSNPDKRAVTLVDYFNTKLASREEFCLSLHEKLNLLIFELKTIRLWQRKNDLKKGKNDHFILDQIVTLAKEVDEEDFHYFSIEILLEHFRNNTCFSRKEIRERMMSHVNSLESCSIAISQDPQCQQRKRFYLPFSYFHLGIVKLKYLMSIHKPTAISSITELQQRCSLIAKESTSKFEMLFEAVSDFAKSLHYWRTCLLLRQEIISDNEEFVQIVKSLKNLNQFLEYYGFHNLQHKCLILSMEWLQSLITASTTTTSINSLLLKNELLFCSNQLIRFLVDYNALEEADQRIQFAKHFVQENNSLFLSDASLAAHMESSSEQSIIKEKWIHQTHHLQTLHGYKLLMEGKLREAKHCLEDNLKQIEALPAGKGKILASAQYYVSLLSFFESDVQTAMQLGQNALVYRSKICNITNVGTYGNVVPEELDLSRTCASFLQIARLNEVKNSLHLAESYYNFGLTLAWNTLSCCYLVEFLTNIGKLYEKRHLFAEAGIIYGLLKSIWTQIRDNAALWGMECLWSHLQALELDISCARLLYNSNQTEEACIMLENCIAQANHLERESQQLLKQTTLDKRRRFSQSQYNALSISSPSRRKSLINCPTDDESTVHMMKQLKLNLQTMYGLLLYTSGQTNKAMDILSQCLVLPEMISQNMVTTIANYDASDIASIPSFGLAQFLLEEAKKNNAAEEHVAKATLLLAQQLKASCVDFVPYLAKPFLSALSACKLQQESPHVASFFVNKSLGVSLRHQKLALQNLSEMDRRIFAFENLRDGMEFLEEKSSNYFTNLAQQLPDSIVVCSICLSHDNSALLITRLEKEMEQPVVMEIPLLFTNEEVEEMEYECKLSKLASTPAESTYWNFKPRKPSYQSLLYKVLLEFSNIIYCSDESTKTSGKFTESEKSAWWKKRFELDQRMKNLLSYLQNIVLSTFKFLVVPSVQQNGSLLEQAIQEISEMIANLLSEEIDTTIIRLVFHALPYLNEKELSNIYVYLTGLSSDIVKPVVDASYRLFVSSTENLIGEENDVDELDTNRVVKSRRVGQSKRRVKEVNYCKITQQMVNLPRKHMVLVVDKVLQQIPWESMPCLRNYSVSRMPSLNFLQASLQKNAMLNQQKLSVDASKSFFVLNPSGDLKNTQQQFQDWFTKDLQWEGIINEQPSAEYIQQQLKQKEVFVYMGHGAGEKYYNADHIKSVYPTICPLVLLMGCSSGQLKENGDYEPNGIALNYLLAGTSCIVAALWDVTDKDIDRFGKYLIEEWLSVGDEKSICEIASRAREECKLKYLIGASTICYGLPMYRKV